MKSMENRMSKEDLIKMLIETSVAPREIDLVLNKHAGLKTEEEKLAYLEKLYPDIYVIDRQSTDTPDMIYNMMLNALILKKWL